MQNVNATPQATIAISKSIQSNVFYDALYKNIPNMYLLHHLDVDNSLESIFDYLYDLIKDYYIEKTYQPTNQTIQIENVYIVLKQDVLIHFDTVNKNCNIMYANADKQYVHQIKNYLLQFQIN